MLKINSEGQFVEPIPEPDPEPNRRWMAALYSIQADLIADPLRWPVVKGTGGARKGRIADPRSSKGKSGSFRYLYLYLEHQGQIYLLYLFAKSGQADLNADQKKVVAAMIETIKRAQKKENE